MDYSSDYNNLTAAELDGEENKMENELVTQENKVKVITPLKDLLVAFMEAKDRINYKTLGKPYEIQQLLALVETSLRQRTKSG